MNLRLSVKDGTRQRIIGEVAKAVGPSTEAPEVRVRYLKSRKRESISGLVDDANFDLIVQPRRSVRQELARLLKRRKQVRNWRVTFAGDPSVSWTFPAYVRSYSQADEQRCETCGQKVPPALTLQLRIAGPITRRGKKKSRASTKRRRK